MGVNGSSAVATMPTSAVDPVVAEATEIQQRMEPLKAALGLGDLTGQEMQLFAMVAQRMRLDPIARQIYAVKRQGKVTFQTGIDGFRSTAEETGQYRGSDEPTFGPIIDKPFPHPEWAQVTVHRVLPDGSRIDQSATVRWDEFYPGDGQGHMWRKMPHNQLAKCAEAAGFRKAFPRTFGQVYVTEEMQQAEAAEQARPVGETARDRIVARAASIAPTTSAATPAGEGIPPAAPPAAGPSPAPDDAGLSSDPAPTVSEPAPDATGGDGAGTTVIEGQAVAVDGAGLTEGELRDHLREALIGITDAQKLAEEMFDQRMVGKLTDQQRLALWQALQHPAAG